MKVGVIGVGYLGKHHARIYSEIERAQLVGVSDIDEGRGKEIASTYGTQFFSEPADLLERVDAASIAVPSKHHYTLAKEALSKRVHTLVEKPIACSVEEASSLVELARKNGTRLYVGHTERFSPPIVALRERISCPLFIECHRLASFRQRGTDIAVVLDLMIHDIDMVLWLVRSPLEKVDAVGIPVLTEHEDIANARMEFASGCIANLTASRVSKGSLRKIRIFQKNEYISINSPGKSVEIYTRLLGEDGRPQVRREEVEVGGDEPLRAELEAFLEEIGEQEKTNLATGEEGRDALVVAFKILQLIRERRARIGIE